LLFENSATGLPFRFCNAQGLFVQHELIAAKIDVRKLPAGQYILEMGAEGFQPRQHFVKVD
jgi:hypothetical protein